MNKTLLLALTACLFSLIAFAQPDANAPTRTILAYGGQIQKAFIKQVIALTGTKQKIVYRPLPVDDPKQRRPDITRAKEVLKWEPKVARKDGLKNTYEYFKSLPPEEWARQPKEFVSRT